jgi:hypothetical protein
MADDAQLASGQLHVRVDTSDFGRGGWVEVDTTYDLVAPTWIGSDHLQAMMLQATACEPVDRYRSGVHSS